MARLLLLLLVLAACGAEAVQGASSARGGADQPPRSEVVTAADPQPDVTVPSPASQIQIYDVRVVRTFPHDPSAFTQGLFFADGALYESTGQRGASVIRRVDLRDGSASAEVGLPDEVFGEGATVVGDRIVSLSWRAGLGFVHDLATLEREGTFPVEGEGWGLTYDEARDRLILSDGTDRLRFLDPDTYEEIGEVRVTMRGQPLPRLNELECLPLPDGCRLLANVWQQDVIAEIALETGAVTGLIDVSGLFPPERRAEPFNEVPNGIAYEPRTERLFLTGKRWPQLFEVQVVPRG